MRTHEEIFKAHNRTAKRGGEEGIIKICANSMAKMVVMFCSDDKCEEIKSGYVQRTIKREYVKG